MGARGMHDVELVDGEPERAPDDDSGGDAGPRTRSRRKLLWWLAGVCALLVVLLGAVQWGIGWRENAAAAQLAAVDGVIAQEIDGPLDVGPSISPAEADGLLGQQGGELVQGPDGSLTYTWGTGSDDDAGWSTQLQG